MFFVTSLSLAYLGSRRQAPTSVIESASVAEESVIDTTDLLPPAGESLELPELPVAESAAKDSGETDSSAAQGDSSGEGDTP